MRGYAPNAWSLLSLGVKAFALLPYSPIKTEKKMENYENFKKSIDYVIEMLNTLKEQMKKEDSLSREFIDTMDNFRGKIEKYLKI